MTGYQDVALIYWERGWAPIPVRGKRPVPAGSTGKTGTVDEGKIRDWMQNGFRYIDPETKEWDTQDAATANTGLRHQGTVGIDVDHYGAKNGADQLRYLESFLGPLPATPSSTARGSDSESRQHVFALPEHVEMYGKPPIEGLKPEDVHIDIIQARHRYSVVWPSVNPDADNAPYLWYDADGELMAEPPHVSDLEYLPQAWIEYLTVGDRDYAHTGEQWDGELPEAATATELRKLHAIISSLSALPDVWAPGAGWHDTVYRAACWLWRIARSNAYVITPDEALQIMLSHTPTYPDWGVDKIIEQWESAEKQTVGQYEEPPAEDRPPLLPWQGFPTDRAFPEVNGEAFPVLWMNLPENTTAAGLWGRRHQLLVAMLRGGFTEQEAATITWHSAAARHHGVVFGGQIFVDPDSRSITEAQLWREVDKAKEEIAQADGASIEAAPADERPSLEGPRRFSFLTDAERDVLAGPAGIWWGSRVMEWARATFTYVNEPYYRMNRWTVLSVIFSPKAVLPRPGGNDRPLNLYQAITGVTTSGKTEALRFCKHIFKAYFLLADSPDIGGNHTPESLGKTLIAKDGTATWFHMDEAHTKIATWKKPIGPYSEMPGVITDVYDGDVGAIYRATQANEETNGKGARAFLTAHFMGTPQGMADVMGPDDWESGFMNRFIWAIGDKPIDDDTAAAGDWIDDTQLQDDANADHTAGLKIYQQWAAEFAKASAQVSTADGRPHRMRLPRTVIQRHANFVRDLAEITRNRPAYADRLRPTFKRFNETVLRCASLVALSQGRLNVTMPDLYIALEQAEEWATNILWMVEATDESLRTREVNAIEKHILEAGGVMSLAAINRLPRFRNRRRDVDDLIGELVAQGRAEKQKNTTTGADLVKTKGIVEERSAA